MCVCICGVYHVCDLHVGCEMSLTSNYRIRETRGSNRPPCDDITRLYVRMLSPNIEL